MRGIQGVFGGCVGLPLFLKTPSVPLKRGKDFALSVPLEGDGLKVPLMRGIQGVSDGCVGLPLFLKPPRSPLK